MNGIIILFNHMSPQEPFPVQVEELKGNHAVCFANKHIDCTNGVILGVMQDKFYYSGALSVTQCKDKITLRLGEMPFLKKEITPVFDSKSMKYVYPFDRSYLDNWVKCEVLKKELYDRIKLCPKCKFFPTFRCECGQHIGECMRCQFRFPSNQAYEEDIFRYTVDLLDIS